MLEFLYIYLHSFLRIDLLYASILTLLPSFVADMLRTRLDNIDKFTLLLLSTVPINSQYSCLLWLNSIYI